MSVCSRDVFLLSIASDVIIFILSQAAFLLSVLYLFLFQVSRKLYHKHDGSRTSFSLENSTIISEDIYIATSQEEVTRSSDPKSLGTERECVDQPMRAWFS